MQYIRWTILRSRGGSDKFEVGGIEFRGQHNELLRTIGIASKGLKSVKGHGAGRSIDGSENEWWKSRRLCKIIYIISTEAEVATYRILTGGGDPENDPSQWKLETSNTPDGPWTVLSHLETRNCPLPTERNFWTKLLKPIVIPIINPAEVLNLSQESTETETNQIIREQLLANHPSITGSAVKFAQIAEAACVLKGIEGCIDPYKVFHNAFGFSWRSASSDRQDVDESPSSGFVTSVVLEPSRRASLKIFNRSWEETGIKEINYSLEIMKLNDDLDSIPVVAVRHGMGYHNDLHGVASHQNRDAALNHVGILQATRCGSVLYNSGIFTEKTLVIISPFKRALQTAKLSMSACTPGLLKKLTILVTPYAAEHTLPRSTVQQGDRGSVVSDLKVLFPEYDFSLTEQYCTERGIDGGQWWRHGPLPKLYETYASFSRRAQQFKVWLTRQIFDSSIQYSNVVIFSHGGLLTCAFGRPQYSNCSIRTLLLNKEGGVIRPSTGDTIPPPASRQSEDWVEIDDDQQHDPSKYSNRLTIHSVRQLKDKVNGHYLYIVAGDIDTQEFSSVLKLSTLRSLHDCIKRHLRNAYKQYDLNSLFPAVHWRTSQAKGAEEWLQQLCLVMCDREFPDSLKEVVRYHLQLSDQQSSSSDELDGDQRDDSSTWVPDKDVLNCFLCDVKFGIIKRKHHCRTCGNIFCNSCSRYQISNSRACKSCAMKITVDHPSEFHITSSIQSQVNGAYLMNNGVINGMPTWLGPVGWCCHYNSGSWLVSHGLSDIGTGVLSGKGTTPTSVTHWKASPIKGSSTKNFKSIDPYVKVLTTEIECEEDEDESDDWWEVDHPSN